MFTMIEIKTADGLSILEVPIIVHDPITAMKCIKDNLPDVINSLGGIGTDTLVKALESAVQGGPQMHYVGFMMQLNARRPQPEAPEQAPEQPHRHGPDIRPQMPSDWTPTDN